MYAKYSTAVHVRKYIYPLEESRQYLHKDVMYLVPRGRCRRGCGPSCAKREADNKDLDCFFYQLGENFLYCVVNHGYSQGGPASFQEGVPPCPPPPNEALLISIASMVFMEEFTFPVPWGFSIYMTLFRWFLCDLEDRWALCRILNKVKILQRPEDHSMATVLYFMEAKITGTL